MKNKNKVNTSRRDFIRKAIPGYALSCFAFHHLPASNTFKDTENAFEIKVTDCVLRKLFSEKQMRWNWDTLVFVMPILVSRKESIRN